MEFLESYEKMIQESYIVLEQSIKYKLKAIKECNTQLGSNRNFDAEFQIKPIDLNLIIKNIEQESYCSDSQPPEEDELDDIMKNSNEEDRLNNLQIEEAKLGTN